MKALLIVDVQNDFMPGGALPVPDGDQVVPVINALQAHVDLVVATQDWHPANHASFASAHAGCRPLETIELDGLPQVLWPDHCVQDSPGAALHRGLHLAPIAAIIRKGMDPTIDSYSGFFDNGKKRCTGLAGYLRELGVNEVYLCGLAAEFCVAYTLQDALELGFSAALVEDATRPLDQDAFARMKRRLAASGNLRQTAAILGSPKRPKQP